MSHYKQLYWSFYCRNFTITLLNCKLRQFLGDLALISKTTYYFESENRIKTRLLNQ